jgi:Intracellular proteinase inhibitor
MRRTKSLIVEPLECRALLSGLTASLTTNQSVYLVGEPIQMTFTFTNSGNTPATFDYGPSFDGFIVTQGGQTVWQSNDGINPMVAISRTLQPGQSFSLQTMWDGSTVVGSTPSTASGSFVVTDQLDAAGASAAFQIDSPPASTSSPPLNPSSPPGSSPSDPPQPPGSLSSDPPQPPGSSPSDPLQPPGSSPSDPPPSTNAPSPQEPPAVTVILTTNHATSHAGKPVRIKITLKNIAKTNAQLAAHAGADGVTVLDGSTVIARTTKSLLSSKARTLKPGQSLHLMALWNGKPNQAGLKQIVAGNYTIEVNEGGYTASANVRIT